MGWLKSIKDKFIKTSNVLSDGISKIFTSGRKIDNKTLEEFEEFLLMSDMGPEIASIFVNNLKTQRFNDELMHEEVESFLREQIMNILGPLSRKLDVLKQHDKPFVIMLCGVNGNGKTTTAGKLAMQFKNQGMSVMLGACDTFRAAAVEQIQAWGDKIGCEVITGDHNSDPASVGYKALSQAKEQKVDVLILDTAGRLHNKSDLMSELQKCVRVIKKIDPDTPHEIVMVLDSTTGQNAYNQISTFKDIVPISGLIFTKLDSSAKGGIIVGAAKKYNIPIYAIGVGEKVEDLIEFSPEDFAKSII
jgi:fused signal recognition particle receptor